MIKILISLFALSLSTICYASSMLGRLGIGMTNHLVTEQSALSLKIQRNRSTALGGHFALDSNDDGVEYALGLKGYKLIYEEPQLNFYSALSVTYLSYLNDEDESKTGYQVDGTFGAEFSFQGLESIGFSFEFGAGLYNYDENTHIQTVGHNMIASAVHFYL